jgi:hypothetical protein
MNTGGSWPSTRCSAREVAEPGRGVEVGDLDHAEGRADHAAHQDRKLLGVEHRTHALLQPALGLAPRQLAHAPGEALLGQHRAVLADNPGAEVGGSPVDGEEQRLGLGGVRHRGL